MLKSKEDLLHRLDAVAQGDEPLHQPVAERTTLNELHLDKDEAVDYVRAVNFHDVVVGAEVLCLRLDHGAVCGGVCDLDDLEGRGAAHGSIDDVVDLAEMAMAKRADHLELVE